MSPASDPDAVVDEVVLLRGYREAVTRFDEARLGRDTTAAFLPLFEALNWAASIDERLDYPDFAELRGLRFARNRVHHQWADALYVAQGAAFDEVPARLLRVALVTGVAAREEPAE